MIGSSRGGQPVAGLGLLELGHGADIAGAELGRVAGGGALEGHQLADPLLVVGARVQHLRILLEHALVDPEEVDPAGERVGAGLEHVGEQLLVVDRLERHLADLQAAVLDRRGEVVDDRVEQAVDAHVPGGDTAGDGEDRAVVGPVLERGDDLVVGDLLALEVALHQRVGALGHLVHQLLAVLLGLRLELVRNRNLAAVLAGGAVVAVGLHVDEVDHAGNLVL